MAQRQLRNLAQMQASKLNANSVELLLKGKKRVREVFLKQVLLENRDRFALRMLINHFLKKAREGDVRSKLFLNRLASERFNKNESSRAEVLIIFHNLAQKGDLFGLRGLLVAARDSVPERRWWALEGLNALAKKGNLKAIKALEAIEKKK